MENEPQTTRCTQPIITLMVQGGWCVLTAISKYIMDNMPLKHF